VSRRDRLHEDLAAIGAPECLGTTEAEGARVTRMMQDPLYTRLAAEPQLTALAIVSRLSDKYSEQFGKKQRSIVQTLLKSLTNQAAQKLFTPPGATTTGTLSSGSVDGSDPPTALTPS
jgi:hypothetical protein